jgi:hypothetical protein
MGSLSGTVTIADSGTGLCLTNMGGGRVFLLPPADGPPQRWDVTEAGDGVRLRSQAGGGLLAALGLGMNQPVQAGSDDPDTGYSAWIEVPGPEEDLITIQQVDPGWVLGLSLLRIYPTPVALWPAGGPPTYWIASKA